MPNDASPTDTFLSLRSADLYALITEIINASRDLCSALFDEISWLPRDLIRQFVDAQDLPLSTALLSAFKAICMVKANALPAGVVMCVCLHCCVAGCTESVFVSEGELVEREEPIAVANLAALGDVLFEPFVAQSLHRYTIEQGLRFGVAMLFKCSPTFQAKAVSVFVWLVAEVCLSTACFPSDAGLSIPQPLRPAQPVL